MASDAIEFLDALEVDDADLLGFSLGSFAAQEVALIRPNDGPGRDDVMADTTGAVRRRLRLGIPNHSLLARVTGIKLPVFVANGDSDPMFLPSNAGVRGDDARAGCRATPERAKRKHGLDWPRDARRHPRTPPPDLTGTWNPDQDFSTRYGDLFEG
jgi:pimeloyl-ACP methyl ester carboxylesterase